MRWLPEHTDCRSGGWWIYSSDAIHYGHFYSAFAPAAVATYTRAIRLGPSGWQPETRAVQLA